MNLNLLKRYIPVLFVVICGLFVGVYLSFIYDNQNAGATTIKVRSFSLKQHSPLNSKSSYNGLVHVVDYDTSIVIDLRYATDNNFTKKKVYPKDICLLQKGTLNKLIAANNEFKTHGYRIKIWDAYRPPEVQQYFWSIVHDTRFIASPYANWSRHNRGAAVDITLVDENGKEIEMPTGFDEFSTNAYRNSTSMSINARNNMNLLTSIMEKHGFNPIQTEWWHYDDKDADNYPVVNLSLSDIQ
ncbi:M15 family metallopeptidase [Clostridium sp. YIM B02505]|uniref:D-alanyl-D-alanine dipeptidase n=1 Tax=Clostridium yunnanense TaxID=2800325 RepID=A0ABS1ELV9_9CLOT|nr:M15 family metallopeptidase [Clostridium yunnanense]MBK1810298.1 M15 family metallopeptidase [Clostridium yunnanense]